MSKLPDTVKWSEEALKILEQTDKESAKAVVTAISKAAEVKDTKEAAMMATADLAVWSKEEKALWVEPYLITLFPTIMALTADKLRPVQIKAEAAGKALVRAHLFFERSNRAAPAPFYSAAAGHGPQSRAGCTRRRPLRSLCRLARGWTDGGHRPAKTQRTQGSGAFFAERLHTRACGAGGRRVACALAGRRISHAPPISPLPLRAALLFAHTPPARFFAPNPAQMETLSPYAVDGMLPLLFKQFEEHRWQTKLGAVKMFTDLAASSTKYATRHRHPARLALPTPAKGSSH